MNIHLRVQLHSCFQLFCSLLFGSLLNLFFWKLVKLAMVAHNVICTLSGWSRRSARSLSEFQSTVGYGMKSSVKWTKIKKNLVPISYLAFNMSVPYLFWVCFIYCYIFSYLYHILERRGSNYFKGLYFNGISTLKWQVGLISCFLYVSLSSAFKIWLRFLSLFVIYFPHCLSEGFYCCK